jgi:hypothetical protein
MRIKKIDKFMIIYGYAVDLVRLHFRKPAVNLTPAALLGRWLTASQQQQQQLLLFRQVDGRHEVQQIGNQPCATIISCCAR